MAVKTITTTHFQILRLAFILLDFSSVHSKPIDVGQLKIEITFSESLRIGVQNGKNSTLTMVLIERLQYEIEDYDVTIVNGKFINAQNCVGHDKKQTEPAV